MHDLHHHMIPSMTSPRVHDFLFNLGFGWKGEGTAVELGSWLGASAVPLLRGLVQAGYKREFWAFDRWQANEQQVEMTRDTPTPLHLNQDVRPLFEKNVYKVYHKIRAIKGNVPGALIYYEKSPIEICIFDAPKKEPVFTECMKFASRFFIPGITVLGLLDYNFYKEKVGSARDSLLAPVRFMEKHYQSFELLQSWEDECPVFFRYVKPLQNL